MAAPSATRLRPQGAAPRALELPDRIIPITNADKDGWHEKWYEGRNMLNFPHPFRACMLGPPNVGKSTICKNIILRADPPFERVVCIHCDPDGTSEYEDVEAEMMHEIPDPKSWAGDKKTLVIIDDLEFTTLSKEQKKCLDRLFGHVSTHKQISVCLCSQDAFNVPTTVRRMSNVFVLWELVDKDSLLCLSRKVGVHKKAFEKMFDDHCRVFRDSICLDLTLSSPYPRRRNLFEPIDEPKDE